jgi:hypothetical protein
MKIEGACHCGAIAYEAEVDPAKASLCHCNDCQAFSGSPFRASVPAEAKNFRLLKGQPRVYVKVAKSGNRRAQGFCGICGSPIYAAAAENPTVFALRLGVVKQRAEIPPQRQIWCEQALDWAQEISGLPGAGQG